MDGLIVLFQTWYFTQLPLLLGIIFFSYLYIVLGQQPQVFQKQHGRHHSFTGFCYLLWITWGFLDLIFPSNQFLFIGYWWYDVGLGLLGTILTLFAAFEFQHKNIHNIASGTLDKHATVTYGEMIEHSFYQGLNLWQILFLHLLSSFAVFFTSSVSSLSSTSLSSMNTSWLFFQPFFLPKSIHSFVDAINLSCQSVMGFMISVQSAVFSSLTVSPLESMRSLCQQYPQLLQCGLLFLVTLPWYFRSFFPINRFSDNYNKSDHQSTPFIRFLYRMKKYQYVFYKHCLLHGFHLSLLFPFQNTMTMLTYSLVEQREFRMYWLFLNTSYVMEFFLQTLVKKDYLQQSQMLQLQGILMLASTLAALPVMRFIHWDIAFLSLVGNFTMRKHDLRNTMLLYMICLLMLSLTRSLTVIYV